MPSPKSERALCLMPVSMSKEVDRLNSVIRHVSAYLKLGVHLTSHNLRRGSAAELAKCARKCPEFVHIASSVPSVAGNLGHSASSGRTTAMYFGGDSVRVTADNHREGQCVECTGEAG